jgi:hypothetical protein
VGWRWCHRPGPMLAAVAPVRRLLGPMLPGLLSPLAGAGRRAAVAPGRCRPPLPRAGSGAVTVPIDAAAGPALKNERCAVPRHAVSRRGGPRQAQPRARRETEIKFTLGLLTSVQCAENFCTKFTQVMQSFRKVCSRCDQKQKNFSQQVKTLRNSLHMNCQE